MPESRTQGPLLPLGLLAVVLFSYSAHAVSVSEFYPHATGTPDQVLPPNIDDASSQEIALRVPIVLYGEVFTSLYVNSNGLLSFITEIPSFFNFEFPLDYPVISPLYSNVDTRGCGAVYYRESQEQTLLNRATKTIRESFSSGSEFTAESLLIATWKQVGYHDKGIDKVNTYQVLVASDGNDSYVEFLYADDGIQWTQGSRQSAGLPDARAQAGFVSSDGRYYTLRGSGTDQVIHLVSLSNCGEPGLWCFHVGLIEENVEHPDQKIVEEPTWFSNDTCSNSGVTLCHSKAQCLDEVEGFCCICRDGYYGNGFTCLKQDEPLRVNGKISGNINGIKLTNLDLQSYVVTSDGRSYTAISDVPMELGYDAQTLQAIGSLVGWLFAKPTVASNARSGFHLTGGVFNHTATIEFPQSGHKVTIQQKYAGLNAFDQLKMVADIQGTLPNIPHGNKIEIDSYVEHYTRSRPGWIVSQASHAYRLEGVPIDHPYKIEQFFEYTECPYGEVPEEISSTLRLKVDRQFINYEATERIVRFSMTSKISLLGEGDPCEEGRRRCGHHSSCVVEGDEFKCVCNPGFQPLYQEDLAAAICVDINECSIGTDDCSIQATCINHEGGFQCQCKAGYTGDGRQCQEVPTCSSLECHPHADCIEQSFGNLVCICRPGFTGDGHDCKSLTEAGSAEIGGCTSNCSEYSICTETTSGLLCVCAPGYHGDGYICIEDERENPIDEPPPQPSCLVGTCWCPQGWELVQSVCVPKEQIDENFPGNYEDSNQNQQVSCNVYNNCHPHARCVFRRGTHSCQCNAGYEGDGYECTELDHSCWEADICDLNAYCHKDEDSGKAICVCNSGYVGDGTICTPTGECLRHEDCGHNGRCIWEDEHYICSCISGFVRENDHCVLITPDPGCGPQGPCHSNAECIRSDDEPPKCRCIAGYYGDGYQCTSEQLSCNVIPNLCDVGAECLYDERARGYRCRCRPGFQGDGMHCIADPSCHNNPGLCGQNAQCLPVGPDIYRCQCDESYVGDGIICKAASKYEGDFLLLNQGMAISRVPYQQTGNNPSKIIAFQLGMLAIGIDIDCLNGRAYWTDFNNHSIKSCEYDGKNPQNFLLQDLNSPEGISLDWMSRNIYWTDDGKKTIEVANLETGKRKVLVSTELVNPRGIAVHPGKGKIFWSDWNRASPKLEWANMDGTNRAVFYAGDFVKLPNSLAIDWALDELCWADAGTKAIECLGIENGHRRTIISNLTHPFGLTISPKHYYWTDWEMNKIQRAERPSGRQSKPIPITLTALGKSYGIVSVPEYCPRLSNACQVSSGGCSANQLCLPTGPGHRVCLCSDEDSSQCNDIV